MSSTATVNSQPHESPVSRLPARKAPFAVTYSRKWALALFCADLTLFVASAFFANLLAERIWHTPPLIKQVTGAAIIISLWILMFCALGLYHRTYAFRVKDELYYTVAALSLGVMPQLIAFTIVPAISTSRVAAVLSVAFSIVMVGSGRAAMHGLRSLRIFKRSSRIAFVGTAPRIEQAVASIDGQMHSPPLLIEVEDIDATLASSNGSGAKDIESVDWFARAINSRCGMLVFTEIVDPLKLPRLVDVASRYHMRVAFAPPRIKRQSFSLSLETSGHQALIFVSQLNACTPAARLIKRLMDVVLASAALIVFAPIMTACALAVYLDSGAPILYRQERVGMGGRTFRILKFRSMRLDAEEGTGAIWVRQNDDRRTRVGAILRRLSFDELPQLFNVLRGDRSLVGPRPERPVFVEAFRLQMPRYDERHLVAPGITGWSQIHMRRVLDPSDVTEKLEYDLRYVEQWTIWLDVAILFKTAVEFLFHRSG
jgi:exopolysaccharide biosynthesis polyprenyl glycosylphosphotransferase